MKLPKDTNPALIASDDETRWAIQHVRIEGSHAIATNGRMMIVQQVEMEEGDEAVAHVPSFFMTEAVKAVEKYGKEPSIRLEVEKGTYSSFGDDRTFTIKLPKDGDLSYPNWRQVLPEPVDRIGISLNSKFLRTLARALGASRPRSNDGVTLWLDPKDLTRPIVVTVPECDERFGILMPLKSATGEEERDFRSNKAWCFARREELLAEAKAACEAAGEFWTPEKEEAAMAAAMGKAPA